VNIGKLREYLLEVFVAPRYVPAKITDAQISEDAQHIKESYEKTVAAIRERLNTLPGDQPLMVLLGEKHDVVSHVIHHMCILDEITNANINFAVGMEYPSNYVLLTALDTLKDKIKNDADKILLAQGIKHEIDGNPTRHKLLYDSLFMSPSVYAPHSNATLANFLKRRQIPIAFIDAAFDEEGYLNWDDPDTKRAILKAEREMGVKAGPKIPPTDQFGMFVRNLHMVEASIRLQRLAGPFQIIFTITGNAHILGYNPKG
jgi:hypothetical protein